MADANVVIAGILFPRWFHEFLRHALRGDFQLVLSAQAVREARTRLARGTPAQMAALEQFLADCTPEMVPDPSPEEVRRHPTLVRDAKDIPIALAAVLPLSAGDNSAVPYSSHAGGRRSLLRADGHRRGVAMPPDDSWRGLLLLVGVVWLGSWLWQRHLAWVVGGRWRPEPRPLRPRTPHDCPGCRAALATPAPPALATPGRPWRAPGRRGGRPPTGATAGFACPHPACVYAGGTAAAVQALVGDGHHGRDRIQDVRCQACGANVSARRDTALDRLTTPAAQVSPVLTARAAGRDHRAASRVVGQGGPPLARWRRRRGEHAARRQARQVPGLPLPQLPLDARRTRLRDQAPGLWRWGAVEPLTTALPALHRGQRHQAAAQALVQTLGQTLAAGGRPALTSDGLTRSGYALTAPGGQGVAGVGRRARPWPVAPGLRAGHVKQVEVDRRRRLRRVVPQRRCGRWRAVRATRRGGGLSGQVMPAVIERAPLTLRRGVAG